MDTFVQELLQLLFTAVIGVTAPVLTALVVQAFRWVNVQLSAAQEAKVRQTVANVLLEVEEWASGRLKAQLPVTSGQKLTRAIGQIVEKLPNVTQDEAEVLVRQELPKVGLGAVNFLAKTAQAIASPRP